MMFVRTEVVCIVWRVCDKIIIVKQKVYCRSDWAARRAFFPHRISPDCSITVTFKYPFLIHGRKMRERETIRNKMRLAVSRTRACNRFFFFFLRNFEKRILLVPFVFTSSHSFRNDRQNNVKRRILNGIILIASYTRIEFRTYFSLEWFRWKSEFSTEMIVHHLTVESRWKLRDCSFFGCQQICDMDISKNNWHTHMTRWRITDGSHSKCKIRIFFYLIREGKSWARSWLEPRCAMYWLHAMQKAHRASSWAALINMYVFFTTFPPLAI